MATLKRVKFENEGVTLSIGLKDKEGTPVSISNLTNIVCEIKKYRTSSATKKLEYALNPTNGQKPLEVFGDGMYARLVINPDDMSKLEYGMIVIRVTYFYPDQRFSSGVRTVTKKGYLFHLKEVD